jgi:diaminopimelate epimerase
MTTIRFTKMAGAGNDFVVVDGLRQRLNGLRWAWPRVSRALCDRRRGIGADGLLVLSASRRADARMRVFNPDGSEAAMCGNGARCVAAYLANGAGGGARGRGGTRTVTIETGAGLVTASVRGGRVRMQMPQPSGIRLARRVPVNGRVVTLASVDTGVPHAVVPVRSLERVDVATLGRAIRRHPRFGPRGTNVDFVERVAGRADRIRVRTYERGVEAETLACGTGAAAAAVIHALRRRGGGAWRAGVRRIAVQTRSGAWLRVGVRMAGRSTPAAVRDVTLEGPASARFSGEVRWPMEER